MKQQKKIQLFLLRMILLSTIVLGLGCLQSKVKAATEYKYLIKVNKQQNCITIYEKDADGAYTVPVKAMICSTGYATPLGTFNTKIKYRWKVLLDGVWGQYSTRITGSILFHSVWYYKQDPSTLSAEQYNKLGTTCSHGCIRLTVEDAKWIYDNCPIGTTVVIYNDKDPGPLGKPTAQKLKAGTGWDPTDPAEENPFNQIEPVTSLKDTEISGAKSKSIDWGSEFDPLEGVTATDGKGNDITSQIKVTGKVNTRKAGKYKLTYTVTDSNDKKVTCTITIKVKACHYKLTFEGVTDRVVGQDEVVDRDYCLEGVRALFGETELDPDEIIVEIDTFSTVYCIYYRATSEIGDTVVAEAEFYIDSTPFVIEAEPMVDSK